MDRICSACDIKKDENKDLKHRTICKKCHNENRRKNNNYTLTHNQQHTPSEKETCSSQHQPKIDNNVPYVSAHKNLAYVVIGPRNVGKTYYMLKKSEKIGNKRPIHIITRSPNQCPKFKTNNEIKTKDKYKGSVVIFDDMLGAGNSSQLDEFFTRVTKI